MSARAIRLAAPMVAIVIVASGGTRAQHPAPGLPLAVPQSPAPGADAQAAAAIRGRVVRQDDRAPLRGARVSVGVPPGGFAPAAVTLTDDEGRFELTGLRPGPYVLTAVLTGYVTLKYGQSRPEDREQVFNLAAGEAVSGLEIGLPRGSVLAGVVIDERGEPAVNTIVQVLRQQWVRGTRLPVRDPSLMDRTDDLGAFRIHGLAPGRYLLSAGDTPVGASVSIAGASPIDGVTTFYPGTLSAAEAQPLNVGPGQEVSGLVLRLTTNRLAAIEGVVQTPDGQPVPGSALVLTQRSVAGSGSLSRQTTSDGDGGFAFRGLPPGEYTISAGMGRSLALQSAPSGRVIADGLSALPSGPVAIAHAVLDGSDVKVPLVLRDGSHARGRIVMDPDGDDTRGVRPPVVMVHFEAANPANTLSVMSLFPVSSDASFDVGGLVGRRVLRVSVMTDGWMFQRATLGGLDITDTPLEFDGADVEGIEIVLTNRVTDISGTIVDADGQPAPGATVVLLAEDRRRWGPDTRFVAAIRSDQHGRFRHRGLPPERYQAVAVGELETGEETNPEMLERLQRAATAAFELGDGETLTLPVPLADLR